MSGEGPKDHWDSIVDGLATLGGSLGDQDPRPISVEEVPLIQADLSYGDLAKDGKIAHLSHPSLLTITVLPGAPKTKRASRGSIIPPIPSHPSIVQRRMEMLTSDMLSRALTLVTKGQHESAHRLLSETRLILQGLGKGSLPPLPPAATSSASSRSSSAQKDGRGSPKPGRKESSPKPNRESKAASPKLPQTTSRSNSPQLPDETKSSNRSLPLDLIPAMAPPRGASTIDSKILHALDSDIEACLEFIDHPAVFSHDARKAALQTIGVISSQRGYTFRSASESIWADRVSGVKRLTELSREWRESGDESLTEE